MYRLWNIDVDLDVGVNVDIDVFSEAGLSFLRRFEDRCRCKFRHKHRL